MKCLSIKHKPTTLMTEEFETYQTLVGATQQDAHNLETYIHHSEHEVSSNNFWRIYQIFILACNFLKIDPKCRRTASKMMGLNVHELCD
jgi:hypothetical protein